jgi:Domain of unknown function (DUF397)
MDPMDSAAGLSRSLWRKSSYSTGNGSNCIEVALVPGWHSSYSGGSGSNCVEVAANMPTWRKSSRSNGSGGECVEVGGTGQVVAVRDSKDPDGPKLLVSPGAWVALLTQVRASQLS